ncbi:3-dehydroquinate synthase [Caldibacillus thermolactis]|jgi:3-dehydroquinate synthase|uniref:3-dehydroquinate synthase n=1 Tax=Pallidibacillus thermolactis TaxID=251051 RepID=A0ABT2WE09_9BACI|nr:3-dehydroquinate synthase [Pallidibacillus thermolactis]MCU9593697.1 3-dehydroquinate synthase [Pallidibacillus thermolactis]
MEKVITVQTESSRYPVFVGNNSLCKINEILHSINPTTICIVTDETVKALHLNTVLDVLSDKFSYHIFTTPIGEKAKSFDVYQQLVDFAATKGLDRKSIFIALGGGAIGDLTGFAAATYMRGVEFIQVPTTILAHDSSVGGKTGINLQTGKNLIGAFHHPAAVIYHLPFLNTLPDNEKRSGFAEIIKESMIHPQSFLNELMNQFQTVSDLHGEEFFKPLIQGLETKKIYVEQDEKEMGVRAYLNLGHTLGHAIEANVGYGKITHGEAVFIGLIFALKLSEKVFLKDLQISNFINWAKKLEYTTYLPQDLSFTKLLNTMKRDKKTVSGQIRFVLLNGYGKPVLKEISDDTILATLKEWKNEIAEEGSFI